MLPEIVTSIPGPLTGKLAERLRAVECPAFEERREARDQAVILYVRGEGSNVWDADGNRFVDLAAGFGALVLGHAHAAIVGAVRAQSEKLGLALGDLYSADVKVALLERLAKLHPDPRARVMLGMSGADAVTAALKTALLATGKPGVIAFEGAYHGLSHGPLAACGLDDALRSPFAAHLGSFVTFVPYPRTDDDLDRCVTQIRANGANAGAILVEPILGRGGCIVPPARFLPELRRLCDEFGALLIADEIWTGCGRSGAMVESLAQGVTPDIVCLGKALGGGMPISACIGSDRAMQGWASRAGTIHTATHFGSPIACAGAMATLDALERDNLLARVTEVGKRWMDRLRRVPSVRGVSGKGLMVGVEMENPLRTMRTMLEKGYIVLTGGAPPRVLTLTPPLNVDEDLLDAASDALTTA